MQRNAMQRLMIWCTWEWFPAGFPCACMQLQGVLRGVAHSCASQEPDAPVLLQLAVSCHQLPAAAHIELYSTVAAGRTRLMQSRGAATLGGPQAAPIASYLWTSSPALQAHASRPSWCTAKLLLMLTAGHAQAADCWRQP